MSLQDRAHPRVSGENVPIGLVMNRLRGSSPRERGKLVPILVAAWNGRLIPA